MSEYKIFLG